MKYVKCIGNTGGTYLTINKIYQVKRNFISDGQKYIEIETDKGVDMLYNINSINSLRVMFIDIQQVRDNKLNELGI